MRKFKTAALALTLACAVLAGCSAKKEETTAAPQTEAATEAQTEAETDAQTEAETEAQKEAEAVGTDINIGSLSGPTSFGFVKLMSDAEEGLTANNYNFAELSTDPSTFVAPLVQGQMDIAAVPSNLASVIYNKSEGKVEVLAVGVEGVLNIVEKGEEIKSIADLAGKKIYATGQGATPEYTLKHILTENGIDPEADVEIQFCTDTTEALSFIKEDAEGIAMLPQPFATAACAQVEGLHVSLDLNDAWADLDNGCSIVTGVVIARKQFVEENPEAVELFLDEYAASYQYLTDETDAACDLIEKYGIVGKAAIAKKALPGCHVVMITGQEMKDAVSGYLQIIADSNPQAVGGKLPGEDFYYVH